MGAWETDIFANDDALDWVAELEGSGLAATTSAFAARDLWEESDEFETWSAELADLKSRLA